MDTAKKKRRVEEFQGQSTEKKKRRKTKNNLICQKINFFLLVNQISKQKNLHIKIITLRV